jgi:hypothetical protein
MWMSQLFPDESFLAKGLGTNKRPSANGTRPMGQNIVLFRAKETEFLHSDLRALYVPRNISV